MSSKNNKSKIINRDILNSKWDDIRDAIRIICKKFPGEYWRKLDSKREYPEKFVNVLTESGYLGCLIPEKYGGSGLPLEAACVILEEIHC